MEDAARGQSPYTIVARHCSRMDGGASRAQIVLDSGPGHDWIRVTGAAARTPSQGWKLHLSASITSAPQVLERALPVLLAEDCTFKVAGSLAALAQLNQGEGGASQVGKFITVYPSDDAQAVRLAAALDAATRGLGGPPIPSDRPLHPDSLVHYRYGGFDGTYLQTPMGEILPAITAPDGALQPDRRATTYHAPDWASDPFLAAGVAFEIPAPSQVVAGRYAIVATLHRSPRGAVYLALDLDETRRCVLKQATRDSAVRLDGSDARERLRHEAAALAHLAPDPRFPALYELFDACGDLFLAMEDVEGPTLEEQVARSTMHGGLVAPRQLVEWAGSLVAAVAAVHAAGMIHRDLKSTNVIVAPDGRVRLVDFELAHALGSDAPAYGSGTRGYMSPQQAAGLPPSVADDIYSLGALLYFAATGAEPSLAPDPLRLLERQIAALNPAIGPALSSLIARCLDPEPSARFPSVEALAAALRDPALADPAPLPSWGAWLVDTPIPDAHGWWLSTADENPRPQSPSLPSDRSRRPGPATTALDPGHSRGSVEAQEHYRRLAHALGDTLCAEAVAVAGGKAWISSHEGAAGLLSRGLNLGSAGPVLALAELVLREGDAHHRAMLAESAQWLCTAPSPAGEPVPGLYVGEAGVGAALLRAGQALRDPALIAAAAERSRLIAALPHTSPDLFNGSAGRLRFHLLLADETSDCVHLRAAIDAGEALLANAETDGDGSIRWTIPPGFGGLSGQAYLGYAHGAAGIGDALLDLYEATGDIRYLQAARGAGRWLARFAVPALQAWGLGDGDGVAWPSVEGGALGGAFWCHGSVGIGRFFQHAAMLGALPEAGPLAIRAARAAARGARWANPVQCHGLAGNVEFLLDMYQWTGDAACLAEAHGLARLLAAFIRDRGGKLTASSESPFVYTPDYMVGYAGVAMCLLRLAYPDDQPHQLSRRGFRFHPAARTERAYAMA